jgi:hypothetical protein
MIWGEILSRLINHEKEEAISIFFDVAEAALCSFKCDLVSSKVLFNTCSGPDVV